MKQGFRSRMDEMHTWVGVLFGALLFAIFWTGSLSVFDKEIDRWMMPATRLSPDAGRALSLDREIRPLLERRAAQSPAWTIILPGERTPFLTLSYGSEQSRKSSRILFDPDDMRELPPSLTSGASGFLYPFHHNLTIRRFDIGAWIVGVASVAMLCLLVSGIAVHRRLFAEFFTFRPRFGFHRSNLDLHNITGVLVLPFHIAITLSGLIIAFSIYFPNAYETLYPPPAETKAGASRQGETPERAFLREALGQERLPKAGRPGGVGSLDAMIAHAETHWGKGSVYLIRVNNPKDAGGNVVLRRYSADTVSKGIDNFRFAAADGRPIGNFDASPTVDAWNFIAGMHYIQFRHWPLRWLYFLGGLAGCVMIATGLFFWTRRRRKNHLAKGLAGTPLVDAVAIAGVGGLIAATLAFFVANQCLPRHPDVFGMEREQVEILAFYATWAFSLLHAGLRTFGNRRSGHLRAWRELSLLIAPLALAAVALNWALTGDHLARTLTQANWPVAGMDVLLILGAFLALLAARRLAAVLDREKLRELAHE
ncbi:MAG: PepSY domain-containing protein [Rhodocyclaceae bacterium]|nr:PepSY domain-containing protein [Rhodocyclaceae bacterium]